MIATSGPGATNLVTGIATAMMDSIPLICITGNVATHLLGTDAFQEADITGITMPITKHNYLVRDVKDLPRIVKEAFTIANKWSSRTGIDRYSQRCIHGEVDILLSGFIRVREFNQLPSPIHFKFKRWSKRSRIEKARDYRRGGVVTSEELNNFKRFAEKTQIPVTTTLMGIGGFSGTHPLWLGMPGMHGTYAANHALLEFDVLIGIGNRFDDRVTMDESISLQPKRK